MTNHEIGTHIRKTRENLKVSQESVAFALDMSQAAYSKIERNETKLKVEQLYKIADHLGISVYDLLPPSAASNIFGENLYGLVWYYVKLLLKKFK
ncbi:helix-turn-helix transcriptional regulator [Sphingobacterium oryzagri]|uniref:Helix-turn-helix transcriptional regulator n=1 Tax=Sphingobacterium oryzagri TaxID=3025669 RepID=A0ABY7WDF7_9SPHI|nr:helix-turn-helix transcriptional regulator [Sphingobacterium sp. KACC 22765]WDF67532.1 helix-turn-helix transcriptional regulator [Sphingobacterium sp. KACC 22765]